MNRTQISYFGWIIFIALLSIYSCKDKSDNAAGILEGNISIGPLCPVETDPPQPGCLPTQATFDAYPVFVYSSDGSKKITLLAPEPDGSFRTVLEPGNYLLVLGISRGGIGSSNLPQAVTIKSSEITTVSISIDTGIR